MREILQAYVERVGELAEHLRGNEQATKQSLVGPLFTTLGYDLTDPRECIPEYRVDFGPNRSIKPIDWAFLQNGHPISFVEAKEVGKKLASFDEQLAARDLGNPSPPRRGGPAERLEHGSHGTHGKGEGAREPNSPVFSVSSVPSVFNKSVRTSERRLLGPSRPVGYEDTVSYFKIHLAERYTWVMSRLYLGRKRPSVWVPLPLDQVQALTPGLMLNTPQAGWTCMTLNASGEIDRLGDVLRAAWDFQKAIHSRKPEEQGAESLSAEGDGATAEEVAIASGASNTGGPAPEPFAG